jgi:L-lactate dehydrogenase complex protein LldG
MKGAREEILSRIREIPAASGGEMIREYRKRGRAEPEERVELFVERLSDYGVRVARVKPSGVGATVRQVLEERGVTTLAVAEGIPPLWLRALSGTVKVLMDPSIGPFGSLSRSGSGFIRRNLLESCDAVLTLCSMAIAETGTMVMDSGVGQGRRVLTLLPDCHVCIVGAVQIVETVQEAIDLLTPGVKDWRSPVTFISGPSATSDIELERVEGVHGPRNLVVILVEDGP